MTSTNAITRQPTQLDYASPTQFKFNIIKLPKVEYFCTEVNIPSLQMTNATQVTPLRDIPLPGTKLDFGDLVLTFMIDEKLENYEEIFGWLRGLGFPGGHEEFKTLLAGGSDRFPTSKGSTPNQGGIFSDATLNILTSKNNPVTEVRFNDCFPISLSSLQYNQQATDTDYLTATVTFEYKLYDFATSNASRTTITTS